MDRRRLQGVADALGDVVGWRQPSRRSARPARVQASAVSPGRRSASRAWTTVGHPVKRGQQLPDRGAGTEVDRGRRPGQRDALSSQFKGTFTSADQPGRSQRKPEASVRGYTC